MKRKIDILKQPEKLNRWVKRSIDLFGNSAYLDNIREVYPFTTAVPQRIDEGIRREIIQAHSSRNTESLISLLMSQQKFPYEEPTWYLLKNVKGCTEKNPEQIKRIADSLYSMTAEETIIRLESPPDLNRQIGPMFGSWLRKGFRFLPLRQFLSSKKGLIMLEASEEEGKLFVQNVLKQNIEKRPDIVAKVNERYIIGEAKWIGQPEEIKRNRFKRY